MARSIYATFKTEEQAERATGALLDHGVAAEDVSFVISDPLMHPTVFHPEPRTTPNTPPQVDVVPPAPIPIPGTHAPRPSAMPVRAEDLRNRPVPTTAQDAVPARTGETSAGNVETRPMEYASAARTAVIPGNTPSEVAQHEHRAHIIDMEADRPRAADGISTTTAGDAAKGAAGGAGIGLGLGILLGIAAVMIPGVGLVAGSGALVAALAAATGVAGGVAGGVYGFLADLGVPPHNARLLSEHLDNGGVVLHIHTGGSVPETEIMRLLNKYEATSAEGF